jgi:hypothetical protein
MRGEGKQSLCRASRSAQGINSVRLGESREDEPAGRQCQCGRSCAEGVERKWQASADSEDSMNQNPLVVFNYLELDTDRIANGNPVDR